MRRRRRTARPCPTLVRLPRRPCRRGPALCGRARRAQARRCVASWSQAAARCTDAWHAPDSSTCAHLREQHARVQRARGGRTGLRSAPASTGARLAHQRWHGRARHPQCLDNGGRGGRASGRQRRGARARRRSARRTSAGRAARWPSCAATSTAPSAPAPGAWRAWTAPRARWWRATATPPGARPLRLQKEVRGSEALERPLAALSASARAWAPLRRGAPGRLRQGPGRTGETVGQVRAAGAGRAAACEVQCEGACSLLLASASRGPFAPVCRHVPA